MSAPSKILIIDDEAIVLRSCSRILSDREVHLARTGSEGLARLKSEVFDLVLTDLKMPEVSGVDILREARRSCPGTRVILMTGFGAALAQEETRDLEPDAILSKPFTPEELFEALARATASKELS